MSDKISFLNGDNSENLYSILKECVHHRSIDSLTDDFDYGTSIQEYSPFDLKMVSVTDSFGDNILEENGRISLAYENLRSIPKRIAEKFATKTKCLDLSYNDFENLSFLSFFDRLHTLILDRNAHLNVNTFPFLPNLRILWINNCEISEMDDWLYRIQDQCPNLQQLSMMGNPGAMSLLNKYPNADYREYVFNILPCLKYLDGVSREPLANGFLRVPLRSSTPDSPRINDNNNDSNKKSVASIKFSELFRFKRRKKSYQSSTTT